ncbi:MAG: cytochrome c oxidase accessory protein CcoG [Planctomycetota bacterium]
MVRRSVAYALIGFFTLVPFIRIHGQPLVLLDIVNRRFTIFGFTFLPTDTVLLAIFVVGGLLGLFTFTALFGRVWCGWACPQTVYMEFLIRPIERLFEGTVGRGGCKKNVPLSRVVGKYIAFFVVCIYLSNTFLAYFVGTEKLGQWITQSPLHHPMPFLVMSAATLAMLLDFGWFREQMCLIACPYGRFQSVLLDENSLIVAYDQSRGEPRGKNRLSSESSLPVVGDCVDCGNCIATCPTGIDIRDGLQMECINCTQCIDACNHVMAKLGRKSGLIRYSSQAKDNRLPAGFLRARTVVYPTLLFGVVAVFVALFLSSKTFDAILLREPGNPFVIAENGLVRNLLKVKITNRSTSDMEFDLNIKSPTGALVQLQEENYFVSAEDTRTFHINVLTNENEFVNGRSDLWVDLVNQVDESRELKFELIGPYNQGKQK